MSEGMADYFQFEKQANVFNHLNVSELNENKKSVANRSNPNDLRDFMLGGECKQLCKGKWNGWKKLGFFITTV